MNYVVRRSSHLGLDGELGHRDAHAAPRCQRWRGITGAAYRARTDLQLRAVYVEDDIAATPLFRGAHADERLAEVADRGRLTLLA